MAESETTGLISGDPKPRYVFESSGPWQRKKRVRQFQCCLCAMFLCGLVVALVATVAFTINDDNETGQNSTNETIDLMILLRVPIDDWNDTEKVGDDTKCQEAFKAGLEALELRDKFENTSATLDKDTASYRHQKIVSTSWKGRSLSRSGYAELEASKKYFHTHRGRNVSIKCDMTSGGNLTLLFQVGCNVTNITCNRYHRYRSYNGSCNNLKNLQYGVAYTPFRRVLPPEYGDGIFEPRKGSTGGPLPSARTVSVVVHRPYYRDDPKFTVMLAVWGQFLDHDLTSTALSQGRDGKPISCCDENGGLRGSLHPECFPVLLDETDPYYKNYNVTCMEFVRSAPAPTCRLGPREQLNQVSSYLDGSVVYGSDDELALNLRTGKDGLLKMYTTPDNRTLLPVSEDPDDGCNRDEESSKGRYCFASGDGRANENVHLTSMHLLWARHHNSLATELKELNPHWDDERLFQEARKILVAQMQHITYNEFLPILLGPVLMKEYELTPKKSGYYKGYNESVDPSMANCFVASAFRFAHTLIPTLVKMLGNNARNPEFIQLHKMLLDPFQLYKRGEMDKALRGAMNTTIQASDPFFSPELKEHLFERTREVDGEAGGLGRSHKLCGLDLVSLNIQRGRDHGLPGYTSWRERCGLQRPRSFRELAGDMDDDSRHYIESIYSHVDDIDLYTGSLSEIPRKDSILGPTITCLILDQFVRLKKGDRFWYENDQKPHVFPEKQLREIRKTKLSNIICDNSDDVTKAQPYVMRHVTKGNENIDCKDIEKPELGPWKEDREDYKRVEVPSGGVSVKSANSTSS